MASDWCDLLDELALDDRVSTDFGKLMGLMRGYCGMTGWRFSGGAMGGGDDIELLAIGGDNGCESKHMSADMEIPCPGEARSLR